MIIQDPTFVTNPVISVVVCCYNQETTIAQTLEGILMQDFAEPFEIVVGDDASRDGTTAICRQYQERFPDKIKLLLHEKNVGVLANFKSVMSASSGKYMAPCAGDDYWIHERKLTMQFAYLQEHEDCGLVHTGFTILHVETGILEDGKFQTDVADAKNLLINGNFIMAPTVLADARLIKQAIGEGILDMGFLMEDFPLWLYIAENKKFGFISESTSVWRKHEESVSNTRDQLKSLHFRLNTEEIRVFFGKRAGRIEDIRHILISRYISIQYWAFTWGYQELATKCLQYLKELNGANWKAYLYGNPFLQRPVRRIKNILTSSSS